MKQPKEIAALESAVSGTHGTARWSPRKSREILKPNSGSWQPAKNGAACSRNDLRIKHLSPNG